MPPSYLHISRDLSQGLLRVTAAPRGRAVYSLSTGASHGLCGYSQGPPALDLAQDVYLGLEPRLLLLLRGSRQQGRLVGDWDPPGSGRGAALGPAGGSSFRQGRSLLRGGCHRHRAPEAALLPRPWACRGGSSLCPGPRAAAAGPGSGGRSWSGSSQPAPGACAKRLPGEEQEAAVYTARARARFAQGRIDAAEAL